MLECSLPIRPMSHLALVPKGASVACGGTGLVHVLFLGVKQRISLFEESRSSEG